jgi:UDPglucose--hexose-1-phosphate uridylyltransferase
VDVTSRYATRLADGRELLYFDHKPGFERSAPDERTDLAQAGSVSQVRWDPLFEEYAVVAGHRQLRTNLPPSDQCPLCPSRNGQHTEIPAEDYEVAVFENRFPAFSMSAAQHSDAQARGDRLSAPGTGRCEVVCFSSDHDASFAQLPPSQARTVIDAWADRTQALSAIDAISYVFCFENRGGEIGATLTHPHGQIYGYPFVPPRFARAGAAAQRHLDSTGRCLQCDQLAAELTAGERIVHQTAQWVAYVPFAARWPYEVRMMPRDHVADLPDLDDAQRDELARMYLNVLQRFDRLFNVPASYIAAWQQAPAREFRTSWHVAAEVFTTRRASDRLKYLAGAESSAATWINDISAETAAARLREAAP